MTQVMRNTQAYANLWPAPKNPAGLVIQMDRKLTPFELWKITGALAEYATSKRSICFHFACSMCDEEGCAKFDLSARFRAELSGEKMLRDSFTDVLGWLLQKTGIPDLPDGFTGQVDLIVREGVDPRTMQQPRAMTAPRRERRYARY